MDINSTTHASPFLSPPPEIRNIIDRHTLVVGDIHVLPGTPPPPTPGLLEVNRQIWSESIDIYYKENGFRWYITDFNADVYITWARSSMRRYHSTHYYKLLGIPDWGNLLRWLEATFEQEAPGVGWEGEKKPYCFITKAAIELFQLVRQMRDQGLTWEQVKLNLERVRLTLAAVDLDWA